MRKKSGATKTAVEKIFFIHRLFIFLLILHVSQTQYLVL